MTTTSTTTAFNKLIDELNNQKQSFEKSKIILQWLSTNNCNVTELKQILIFFDSKYLKLNADGLKKDIIYNWLQKEKNYLSDTELSDILTQFNDPNVKNQNEQFKKAIILAWLEKITCNVNFLYTNILPQLKNKEDKDTIIYAGCKKNNKSEPKLLSEILKLIGTKIDQKRLIYIYLENNKYSFEELSQYCLNHFQNPEDKKEIILNWLKKEDTVCSLDDFMKILNDFQDQKYNQEIILFWLKKNPEKHQEILNLIEDNQNQIQLHGIAVKRIFSLQTTSQILFTIFELNQEKFKNNNEEILKISNLFKKIMPSEQTRSKVLANIKFTEENKLLFITLLADFTKYQWFWDLLKSKQYDLSAFEIFNLCEKYTIKFAKNINLKNYVLNDQNLTEKGLTWLKKCFKNTDFSGFNLETLLIFLQLPLNNNTNLYEYIQPNIKKELQEKYLENPKLYLIEEDYKLLQQILGKQKDYISLSALINYLKSKNSENNTVFYVPNQNEALAMDILDHVTKKDFEKAKTQYQELLKNRYPHLKPEEIQEQSRKIHFERLYTIINPKNYKQFFNLLTRPNGLDAYISIFSTTEDGCYKNVASQLNAHSFGSKGLNIFPQFIYDEFYKWASEILKKYDNALVTENTVFEGEKIRQTMLHYPTFLLQYQNQILCFAPELQDLLTQLNLNNDPTLSQDEQENRLAKIKQAFSLVTGTLDENFMPVTDAEKLKKAEQKQLACLKYLTTYILRLTISDEDVKLAQEVLKNMSTKLQNLCAENKIPKQPKNPKTILSAQSLLDLVLHGTNLGNNNNNNRRY